MARVPAGDKELVQLVDSALADATARSAGWLACRPGCTQCCHGVFAISALDAARLQGGYRLLTAEDPARAARVRVRAAASVQALGAEFPGNPLTGILGETKQEAADFVDFGNDEPCPALDPLTGTCDLYAARPLTCRIFGPPVLQEIGSGEMALGTCELCYQGASEAEVSAGEMYLTHAELETTLTREVERASGRCGATIVAFALAGCVEEDE